jgi:hypothetical protein
MTRRRDWSEPYFLVFQIIGNQFNDSWFYCYQMIYDIYNVYKTKVEAFQDFGDVYMSFIFNLLSNSLQIKISSEAMVTAVAKRDTITLVRNIAKICRIVLDFDSYQNAGMALPNGSSTMAQINEYF